MAKRSGRKTYSAEFREKAVRLVTERGYTHGQVAEQLGCSECSIKKWKEIATRKLDPELAARIELEEDETKRLRKENAQLKQEVEILKKATAYFAREMM
jgi:transposase-like protein